MCRTAASIVWCASIFLCLAQGRRDLHVIVTPDDQTSVKFNKHLKFQMPDLPLNDPEVVRRVKHYEPEGVHLAPWQQTSSGWTILVSWQTGAARVAKTKHPPKEHDPSKVPGVVKWGRSKHHLTERVQGDTDIVYYYKYGKDVGGYSYASPIIHHVLLEDLTPLDTIYYSVGSDKYGFSDVFKFKVPGATHQLPVRIGLIGDLGQTANSSTTVKHLRHHKPDIVWHVGDSCYADNYCSNVKAMYCKLSSDQRRWDSWARMTEHLFSTVPVMHIHGNHDREMQTHNHYQTFTAINARYPVPQDPSVINTSPNHANKYLDVHGLKPERFHNEAHVQPNNSYYSHDLPGAHLIVMSTYVPYGRTSKQYAWFVKDIESVDREITPWLIVMFHASPRNNYVVHFKEVEEFMELYEPLFYQHKVDLVFSGHTHAYERTRPMYNYTVDVCGPMYTCIGDGGNVEGLARWFIDDQPPAFCDDPYRFTPPAYQPSPSGKPVLTFQDGKFCPEGQPIWSAYRDPSFGHGMLTIHNATHAEWEWYRNQDREAVSADRVFIERSNDCSLQRPKRAYAVEPREGQSLLRAQAR